MRKAAVLRAAKKGQPDTVTDEEVIGRVCGGETRMFDELVRRYQDQVYGMAARFVGQTIDAEDIAQEVFLKAFRGLEAFQGHAKFSTWLYRITFNLCTDWLRRNRKPGRKLVSIDQGSEIPDDAVDVGERLVAQEELAEAQKALHELPERYRTVLILLYYQKLSYEQIGSILDLPTKTVETRLYRARRMLRERLEEEG